MEVKNLEKGGWLVRIFSVLIIPTRPPGSDRTGCSVPVYLQEGQVAGEELRAPLPSWTTWVPRFILPVSTSSPDGPRSAVPVPGHLPCLCIPMLIYNLQPPGQSPFLLTFHCPIVTSYPAQGLASWMRETSKGKGPLRIMDLCSVSFIWPLIFHLRKHSASCTGTLVETPSWWNFFEKE